MASKLRSRIPWHEKMERPKEPRIVQIKSRWRRWQQQYGKGTMLIATPRLVEALMRRTPKGKLLTIGQIRERLAKDFGAATTCPLTTGIFARIVAEAAHEKMNDGKKRITPFWRLVRDDGSLMEKFPGGVHEQAKLLRKEGCTVVPGKGKKAPRVKDFEKRLGTL